MKAQRLQIYRLPIVCIRHVNDPRRQSPSVQRPEISVLDVKSVTNHSLHRECITHVVLASPIPSTAINRLSRRGAADAKSTRASGGLLGRRQSAVPMWHGKQLRQRSPINTRDQFRQKIGNPTSPYTPHTLFRVAPNNSDIVIPYGYAVCHHAWMVCRTILVIAAVYVVATELEMEIYVVEGPLPGMCSFVRRPGPLDAGFHFLACLCETCRIALA